MLYICCCMGCLLFRSEMCASSLLCIMSRSESNLRTHRKLLLTLKTATKEQRIWTPRHRTSSEEFKVKHKHVLLWQTCFVEVFSSERRDEEGTFKALLCMCKELLVSRRGKRGARACQSRLAELMNGRLQVCCFLAGSLMILNRQACPDRSVRCQQSR